MLYPLSYGPKPGRIRTGDPKVRVVPPAFATPGKVGIGDEFW